MYDAVVDVVNVLAVIATLVTLTTQPRKQTVRWTDRQTTAAVENLSYGCM